MPFGVAGKHRHLVWLGVLAGAVLAVIGLRFLLVPEAAQRTFGLSRQLVGFELAAIIGLRDIWLALLAVAFGWLRLWKPLALWFMLGAVVCMADGSIIASSSGKLWALLFHGGSGLFCLLAGLACWRAARGQG